MAVPTSGAVGYLAVQTEFGRGSSSTGYRGTTYYKSGVTGAQTFPSSNFASSLFYGTSPDDEWNCACDCANCNCGK